MRFFNQPHAFYCGALLHARTLSLYLFDAESRPVVLQARSGGTRELLRR
jgi:hypothetical protein